MTGKKGGNIINIASILASSVLAERGAYGASKAGLLQLTRYLAVELAPYNIRCNTICPGPFDTEMRKKMTKEVGDSDNLTERIPMGRIGHPYELGGTVVYLASDASSYVTGITIYVDGGWSARS